MPTASAKPAVNTKTARRRTLRFNSLDELRHEVKALAANPNVQTTGNWTPAQAIDHLAAVMEGSLDGVPFKAPWIIRLMSPLFRNKALHKGISPGIQASDNMRAIMPAGDVTLDDAMARMDRIFARLDDGEKMTRPSPVFGKMSHEDWTNLHCRHGELHLSFMHPQ